MEGRGRWRGGGGGGGVGVGGSRVTGKRLREGLKYVIDKIK